MDLVRRVEQELRGIISPGAHMIVGISGGADSVGLLNILADLRSVYPLSLEAVHVHHGIRGEEADRDEAFSQQMCQSLQIPLACVHRSVPDVAVREGISTEEAGRRCRYEAFAERRKLWMEEHPNGEAWVAVAHHRDDQAETVLLNLCRGTGIRGLAGMRILQDTVIRPLLFTDRQEIRRWLRRNSIGWVEDETNGEDAYTRNRIRNHLLPMMQEELNPRVTEHLAGAADQLREIDDYLQQEADRWVSECVSIPGELSVPGLKKLHPALRKRILMTVLEQCAGSSRDLTMKHVEALDELTSGSRGRRIHLPYDLEAVREREILRIRNRGDISSSGCDADVTDWQMECRVFPYTGEKIPEKEYTKWFDYDKIYHNVCLRRRTQGDTIELAGVGRKALRRYMIDAHIPAEERDRIPVLADGDRIMWLVGHRMSCAYQIHEDTKNVLEVTCRRIPVEETEE